MDTIPNFLSRDHITTILTSSVHHVYHPPCNTLRIPMLKPKRTQWFYRSQLLVDLGTQQRDFQFWRRVRDSSQHPSGSVFPETRSFYLGTLYVILGNRFERRVRDSNPRSPFGDDSLVNCCFRPLSQLSMVSDVKYRNANIELDNPISEPQNPTWRRGRDLNPRSGMTRTQL